MYLNFGKADNDASRVVSQSIACNVVFPLGILLLSSR